MNNDDDDRHYRRLHSAWQRIKEDSWKGRKTVFCLLNLDIEDRNELSRVAVMPNLTASFLCNYLTTYEEGKEGVQWYTHWQPFFDFPPVWEN